VLGNFAIIELEARENAALQKASKEKSTAVKEQQTKNAAKQLEQEVQLLQLVIHRTNIA